MVKGRVELKSKELAENMCKVSALQASLSPYNKVTVSSLCLTKIRSVFSGEFEHKICQSQLIVEMKPNTE
jgi:hypothetical protein